ncbi:hypothetical protein HDE_08415 [Halotydeus destructor]|nr:hypothetical protein HDE_08415 [Halotydeus destructor]
MSTDLFKLLDLPANYDVLKSIVLTSDDLNNSSFAVHSLIQSRVRSVTGKQLSEPLIVLVLTNNTFAHYSTVAAKSFGLNLKNLKDTGKLMVFDLLTDYDIYVNEKLQFEWFVMQVLDCLTEAFKSREANGSLITPLVILDDLSIFLSLGASVPELYMFLANLRSYSHQYNFGLIIQSNLNGDAEDFELKQLVYSAISCADIWLEFNKLETGYSQQVDGTLVLHDRTKKLSNEVLRKFHFKTSDRLTKLFTPGSIN